MNLDNIFILGDKEELCRDIMPTKRCKKKKAKRKCSKKNVKRKCQKTLHDLTNKKDSNNDKGT